MSTTRNILFDQIEKYLTYSFPDNTFFGSPIKRNLLATIKKNYFTLSPKEKLQVVQFYKDLFDKSFTTSEKNAIARIGKHYKRDAVMGAIEGYTFGYIAGVCLSKNYIFNVMMRIISMGIGAYQEIVSNATSALSVVDQHKFKQKLRDFSLLFHALELESTKSNIFSTNKTQLPRLSRM